MAGQTNNGGSDVKFLKTAWHEVPGLCVTIVILFIALSASGLYWYFGSNDLIKLLLLPGWILLAAIVVRIGSLIDIGRG